MIRAVTRVSAEFLEARRRAGLDRRDEIWDGELHMAPAPHNAHQRLNDLLGVFFMTCWEPDGLGRTFLETNVKRPDAPPARKELGEKLPADFRIPDRCFLLPERYDRDQAGWIVDGPDVVLEIRSPGDEIDEKLPFYFALGVREAILIDRDTRAVTVLARGGAAFESVPPDADGWHRSAVLRTELRPEPAREGDRRPPLRIRRSDDPARERLIGD